jgi:threonine dehydrogenase-like Zn-dependent dehydrogenase
LPLRIIVVDGNDDRLAVARKMRADATLNFKLCNLVTEIMKVTGGRGVDSSIEAMGTQSTYLPAPYWFGFSRFRCAWTVADLFHGPMGSECTEAAWLTKTLVAT